MKTMLFIYNSHAGKGQVKTRLADILEEFSAAGWLITVHPTRGAGDGATVAAALGGQYDRVVCAGGDGTLHEVVTGLMALAVRPAVGYLPAGTTNDFAKNLDLPRSMASRAAVAANGVPRAVDIGQFGSDYFVYVAAFGAFTDVAYNTPQQFKNLFGHLAYVLEGVPRIASLQAYDLRVAYDDGEIEGEFIYGMVSNTISVGGFRGVSTTPVVLDDGLFEVVLVRRPQNALQLQAILKSLIQMTPDEGGMVTAFRTETVHLTCDRAVPWTLDGEYGGDHHAADIKNLGRAVEIIYGK